MKRFIYSFFFLVGFFLLGGNVFASTYPQQLDHSTTSILYKQTTDYSNYIQDLGNGFTGTSNSIGLYLGNATSTTIWLYYSTTTDGFPNYSNYRVDNLLSAWNVTQISSTTIGATVNSSSLTYPLTSVSIPSITFNPAYYYFIGISNYNAGGYNNYGNGWYDAISDTAGNLIASNGEQMWGRNSGYTDPFTEGQMWTVPGMMYYDFAPSGSPPPSVVLKSTPFTFTGQPWSINLFNPGNLYLGANYVGVSYSTSSVFATTSPFYTDSLSLSTYSGATNTASEIDNLPIPQTALTFASGTTYYASPWINYGGTYLYGSSSSFALGSLYTPPVNLFLTNASDSYVGSYTYGTGIFSTGSPNAIVTITTLSTTTCAGYLDIPCELGNWSSGVFNFLFGVDPNVIEAVSQISLTKTAPFNIISQIQTAISSASSSSVQVIATTTLSFNFKGTSSSTATYFEVFGPNLLHKYISDPIAGTFRGIILSILTVGFVYGIYREILWLAKAPIT
jgi:hypothetical protein